MIFNTDNYGGTNWDAVKESQYEPGLYGALMTVYETECNYNLMMKAVGLSELKYYQETGGELFLQEAGAARGFIEKAKALFKSIIEKIKGIFKKFASVINSYVASDKDFVKKYEKELLRKDLKDFEFKGYAFKDGDMADVIKTNVRTMGSQTQADISGKSAGDWGSGFDEDSAKDDALEKSKNGLRAQVVGQSNEMEEDEFRDHLKNAFYGNDGDKDTLEKIDIRKQLGYIRDASANIKGAEKTQKETVKAIEDVIKWLDKASSQISKAEDADKDAAATAATNKAIKAINKEIDLNKSLSNDFTVAFGMQVQALKDRNRQAKAICVKALSYKVKNESYSYQESGRYSDLFAGVQIL